MRGWPLSRSVVCKRRGAEVPEGYRGGYKCRRIDAANDRLRLDVVTCGAVRWGIFRVNRGRFGSKCVSASRQIQGESELSTALHWVALPVVDSRVGLDCPVECAGYSGDDTYGCSVLHGHLH